MAFGLMCLVVTCGLAFAAPQSIPNGPWIQDNQEVQLNALMSNEELEKTLYQIESRAKGRMTVEVSGNSTTGLPIFLVKFGEAAPEKLRVLIEGQIHGNEPLGPEAAVELIKQLAASGNPDIDMILEELTIWIVPRLNVEGRGLLRSGRRSRPAATEFPRMDAGRMGVARRCACAMVLQVQDPARL